MSTDVARARRNVGGGVGEAGENEFANVETRLIRWMGRHRAGDRRRGRNLRAARYSAGCRPQRDANSQPPVSAARQ